MAEAEEFDVVAYINNSFPTEQSLAGLGDVISSLENEISTIDKGIREFVRDQTGKPEHDGVTVLATAQASIEALVAKVLDMRGRAEQSEVAVRDMTRDIRQLDFAKKNLTDSMKTLNHLSMLVSGVETLNTYVKRRQYEETTSLLQGVAEVVEHFDNYHSIPQIAELSRKVSEIKKEFGDQISLEFRESFSQNGSLNGRQMTQACLVLDVLDSEIKRELLQWFVQIQLEEYSVLYEENEDTAWLDKIDKRFAWLKKHLIQFEEGYGAVFPVHWEVSQRIAMQFCNQTREGLSKVMLKRRQEIDVKLLLTAIQKTYAFENLLFLRFGGNLIEEEQNFSRPMEKKSAPPTAPSSEKRMVVNTYYRIITQCYDPFLDIYIGSQDKNLGEFIEKFVADLRTSGFPTPQQADATGIVLSNCADLFVFYKKCLVQCTQLSCGEPLLGLADVFSKRLRDYCTRILQANLPKVTMTSAPMASVTTITRELRDLSTSGLIQNLHSLLKEGEAVRFSRNELYKITCILTTAEYCMETIQQLEEKLREKLTTLASKLNMEGEKRLFLDVIDTCVTLLVQDLYSACEPVLTSMHKTNWQLVATVGDQSAYISAITSQWRVSVPTLRDFLGTSRKYFVLFCLQFAKLFMTKFMSTLYKCKNVSKTGTHQLLLDTQSLKTALLDLPSVGLTVKRKPPDKYSKLIVTKMGRMEMILKVVMTERLQSFVEITWKLVPDCDLVEFMKLLEMKGVKRPEQGPLIDDFKAKAPSGLEGALAGGDVGGMAETSSAESSKIKRLEKLIKRL